MFNKNETPYHTDSVFHLHMVRVHFEGGHASTTFVHTVRLKAFVRKVIDRHGPGGSGSPAVKVAVADAATTVPDELYRFEPSSRILTMSWRFERCIYNREDSDPIPFDVSMNGYLADALRFFDQRSKECETCIEELVRVRIEFLDRRRDEEHIVDERDMWRVLHAFLRADSPEEESIAAVSYSRVDTSNSAVRRLQIETGEIRFEDGRENLLWMHPKRQRERAVRQAQEDCYECLDAEHDVCATCGGITSLHPDYPASRVDRLARCMCKA